jgi:hypothetical protein
MIRIGEDLAALAPPNIAYSGEDHWLFRRNVTGDFYQSPNAVTFN